jgi:peptidoglycan/xylan/chitin deacetylase (PgdA/CDA1 family)
MVNGVICERDPQMVRRMAELGHEIVNHSWGMDVIPVYFDEAAEKANLDRNHRLLKDRRRRAARLDQPARHRQPEQFAPAGRGRLPAPRRRQRRRPPYVMDFGGRASSASR